MRLILFPLVYNTLGFYNCHIVPIIICHIISKIVSIWKSIMVNQGQMLHCDNDCLNMKINHGQPWSNVALWQRLSTYENKSWLTMVNHGVMSHYAKYCLSMKINRGQPWSNVTLWQILSQYEILFIGFIILILRFNINPLGL